MTADGPVDPAQHPKSLGGYAIDGLIGAGGMGIVYLATDAALQRQVALKTLLPALAADPEFVARFTREAQSAAALNHPNITQIYAIGREGNLPFFAMELIRGRSLETLLRETGPPPPAEAAGLILQAAHGLRHASQKKLIHRDVKPSNLMLTEDGIVKITDFGLAKAARSETQITVTGAVLGSPGYISPEQAQGGEIDARADIYSLGATFYHLVSGRLPFDAPTPVAMIIKHMNEPLRSPRVHNPAIPYPIAACIQKMMAKRPAERFQDYDALIRELERAAAAAPASAAAGRGTAAAIAPGAARSWTGMTGAEARPARARPVPAPAPSGEETETRRGGISWLPVSLAAALVVLLGAGLVQHRKNAVARQAEQALAAAPAGSPAGPSRTGIDTRATFTTRPAGRPDAGDAFAIGERLRERLRERQKPRLAFTSNDHDILPDGRLKVFGTVHNSGEGAATQVRVRIRIVAEDGAVLAQGETPLTPSSIEPNGSAGFELPIDYAGPVGTIKAELVWVE